MAQHGPLHLSVVHPAEELVPVEREHLPPLRQLLPLVTGVVADAFAPAVDRIFGETAGTLAEAIGSSRMTHREAKAIGSDLATLRDRTDELLDALRHGQIVHRAGAAGREAQLAHVAQPGQINEAVAALIRNLEAAIALRHEVESAYLPEALEQSNAVCAEHHTAETCHEEGCAWHEPRCRFEAPHAEPRRRVRFPRELEQWRAMPHGLGAGTRAAIASGARSALEAVKRRVTSSHAPANDV